MGATVIQLNPNICRLLVSGLKILSSNKPICDKNTTTNKITLCMHKEIFDIDTASAPTVDINNIAVKKKNLC